MKPKPYAEVYKREDGLWDWRLKSVNGQIIATSGGQAFTERGDAIEGWLRVFDACDWPVEVRNA